MARITAKGNFQLNVVNLPTFKKTKGILDKKEVNVDFNKIEVSYNGIIRVWVEDKFVKHTQVFPLEGEELYFEFMNRELQKISAQRIREKKSIKKQARFTKQVA